MLVSAFGGKNRILEAYRFAIDQGFRFYSYGDAMFVEPSQEVYGKRNLPDLSWTAMPEEPILDI